MESSDPNPDTYFAPAGRESAQTIGRQVHLAARDSILNILLQSVNGLLAVLNSKRQVIGLNDNLLKLLGIDDPYTAFGLRPGEIIGCVNGGLPPDGCGTTPCCASCGAAIALLSCQLEDQPVERNCAVTVVRPRGRTEYYFRVRAVPLNVPPEKLTLFFLQDITSQQRWLALDRTFFHDVNNLVMGLLGSCEDLLEIPPAGREQVLDRIGSLSRRLAGEIASQRKLLENGRDGYQPIWSGFTPRQILEELETAVRLHPASAGRRLRLPACCPDMVLTSDKLLLLRVLSNMAINALEATPAGGEVLFQVQAPSREIVFSCWNAGYIPPERAVRIFEKNFSTKAGTGRGLGTYSMKLLGEEFLHGKVHFTSSTDDGTWFFLSLPCSPPGACPA